MTKRVSIDLNDGDAAIIVRADGCPEIIVGDKNAFYEVPHHILALTELIINWDHHKDTLVEKFLNSNDQQEKA